MDVDDIDMLADLDSINRDDTAQYLQALLRKTMEENRKLESQISDAKNLLKECSNLSSDTPSLDIVESWKRIHCNKYVFGFHIRKCPNSESLDVKNIILNWNSTFSPTYKIRIFQLDPQNGQNTLNEYPVESTIVRNESLILIITQKPDFYHKLKFSIDGILLYGPVSSEECRQIKLPVLEMDCKDIGGRSFEITYSDVLQREIKNFLTCLVVREEFNLVAKVANSEALETALSDLCGCEIINFNSTKRIYLIRKLNIELEGNLIEITWKENHIFDVKIIARNEDVLFQILHHLYNKIDGFCILPTSHEVYLYRQDNSEDAASAREINKEKLAEKLRTQLKLFEEFCKSERGQCSRTSYLKFRTELDKLQLDTDLLFLKCCSNI